MSKIDLILAVTMFFILTFPGVILAYSLLKEKNIGTIFFVGTGIGLVWAIFSALISQQYFPVLIGTGYIIAGFAFFKTFKATPEDRESETVLIFIIAIIAALTRVRPLFYSFFPLGVDPAFHLAVAKIIYMEKYIPKTMEPFEAIRISFPVGLHAFLSSFSRVSGVELHDCFKALFPVIAGLSSGLVFLLARQFTGSVLAGVASAMSYSFLAGWGSFDYYITGKIPNAVGMALLMTVLVLILSGRGLARVLLAGFILGGIAVIQYHSLVVSVLVLLFILVYDRVFIRERENSLSGRVGITLIVGGLVAFPYLLSRWDNIMTFTRSSAFEYYESFIPIFEKGLRIPVFLYYEQMGLFFMAIALPGLIWVLIRGKGRGMMVLLAWIAALFSAFGVLEYLMRLVVFSLDEGHFYSAMTPSLFLVDTAYPLSIAAGFLIYSVLKKMPKAAIGVVMAVFALLCGSWATWKTNHQAGKAGVEHQPFELNILDWEREFTEPSAFIANSSMWSPYYSYREVAHTPLIVGEDRDNFSIVYKRDKLQRSTKELETWAEQIGRPVYLRMPAGKPIGTYKFVMVFENPRWRIYKYDKNAGPKRKPEPE